MKKMTHWLLALLCFAAFSTAAQEQKLVSGTVKDNDGSPVVSATIAEKNTKNSVTSNERGEFKIKTKSGAILVVSSVGYETKEVVVTASPTLEIRLENDAKTMSDVIVTALGVKRDKKVLGYATNSIKSEDLVK